MKIVDIEHGRIIIEYEAWEASEMARVFGFASDAVTGLVNLDNCSSDEQDSLVMLYRAMVAFWEVTGASAEKMDFSLSRRRKLEEKLEGTS